MGQLELSLDDGAAAIAHLEQVARIKAKTGFREPGILPFTPDYIEALIAVGDLEKAAVATEELESQGIRLKRKIAVAAAARCRGQLAAAGGDLAAAVENLADARAVAAELGQPFELARTLLVQGTIFRRARRVAEARKTLNQALALFEELGATLWAQRARRELARLGGRPSQTAQLTPTEQQVADLVASGKSNLDVAHALHVSPKTVEWNLSKVYKKLRVSSRTELAAKLAVRPD